MDNDLNRSVRLLEDALLSPNISAFKATPRHHRAPSKLADLSITLAPHEMQLLLKDEGMSFYNETINLIAGNKSIVQSSAPWKNTVSSLYTEFFEVLQSFSGSHDVLEIISDLGRCCNDALKVVQGLKSKVANTVAEEERWLENERNTWRLIFVLYQDRLHTRNPMMDDIVVPYNGLSEKLCVEKLFKRDNLVRECQLIIDWLEKNASEVDDSVLHFSDCTTGWENTLHQLKSADTIAFSSSRGIVTKMDPDAPHYQGLPLHDMDLADEKSLCRKVFLKIRCGKLEEAQQLCNNCGHAWRASMLEGWRLYHNPNIDETLDENEDKIMDDDADGTFRPSSPLEVGEYYETEGNPTRDIWKNVALKYTKNELVSIIERASVGAFCGGLEVMLPICDSWEDVLWAYMRTMVDIRVESEIRDNVEREYLPLPEYYWDQRISLNEIFTIMDASKNARIKSESLTYEHMIQKYIILDDIESLTKSLAVWIENTNITTHFLRFAAHLVLFMDQIGQNQDREIIENVLETYIRRLIEMKETQLIAFYVSKLGSSKQVKLYASYLESIVENEERQQSLGYAENCGLNVLALTVQVVENIKNRPQEMEIDANLSKKVTESDLCKISALDWVTFYEEQRAEALQQCNSFIFNFLILRKLDAAQLAFNKIPGDTAEILLPESKTNPNLAQCIKDHLSYKIYLEAQEAFSDWFQHFKSKPHPPEELPQSAQFTDKVAHQHKISQFNAETERWKLTLTHLAKRAKTLLYNVLLFPDGWLDGAQDAHYLRSTCIPEVVFLLYSILSNHDLHEECLQLADVIANEKWGLYKVFSKEKLEEILTKLCESSLALLKVKKDPWGNETSA